MMSFDWEWEGNVNPEVKQGTATLYLLNKTIRVPMSSFREAHDLAQAIGDAVKNARRLGRKAMLDEISTELLRIEP